MSRTTLCQGWTCALDCFVEILSFTWPERNSRLFGTLRSVCGISRLTQRSTLQSRNNYLPPRQSVLFIQQLTWKLVLFLSVPAVQHWVTFFRWKLPHGVVFALVSSDAYTGSLQKNPLNSEHRAVERFTDSVDSETFTYKTDAPAGNYLTLVSALGTQLGNRDFETTPNIKYRDFLCGHALYPFDFTQDHCSRHFYQNYVRNVRVMKLKFGPRLLLF